MAKTVRIGIIGSSWWVEKLYLPSLNSHPDAEVVAICGRRREPAEALASAEGIAGVYTDYREMIAQEELDAVVISTPDDTHAPMTIAAVEAGLHVLCEKPLANDVETARAMLDRATAAGVRHMVMFTWRFQPYARFLKRLIDEGYIGRCHRVVLDFVGGWAFEPVYHWRLDAARATGVAGDLATHMADLYRYFAGEIRSVSGDFLQVVDRSGFDGPPAAPASDSGFIALRGVDGAQGLINVGSATPSGDRDMRITVYLSGDKGAIELRHIFDGVEKGIEIKGITQGDAHYETLEVPADLLDGLAADDFAGLYSQQSVGPRLFVDAIAHGAEISTTFFDGVKAQEVADAALRSSRERRWIDLD